MSEYQSGKFPGCLSNGGGGSAPPSIEQQLTRAQSELAALREELAAMTADRDQLKGIAKAYIASDGAKDLRIVASEQRNAELTEVLELLRICESLGADLKRTIDAALKPTESGASE